MIQVIISFLFKVPIIIGLAMANNIDQHGLTSVFPDNGPSMIDTKGFSFSKTYSSSGSSWSTTWNENRVFEAMFKYENANHVNEEYEFRIGKGGQI